MATAVVKNVDMQSFEYDPANAASAPALPSKKQHSSTSSSSTTSTNNRAMGMEMFNGKLFSGATLQDKAGIESLLASAATTPSTTTTSAKSSTSNTSNIESPVERLLRLQKEVSSFQADMSALASMNNDTVTSARSGVADLQRNLDACLSDRRIAPFLAHNYPSTETNDGAAGAFVHQIANAAAHNVEGFKYEVVGKGFADSEGKLSDTHLTALEGLVGKKGAGQPLSEQLNHLTQRVNAVEPARLDMLTRRVKALRDALAQQQNVPDGVSSPTAEQAKHVDALVSLASKHNADITNIPAVVSKLQANKDTHDASAALLQRMTVLETQAEAVKALTNADKEALAEMGGSFGANMSVMQANFAALQAKADALAKRESS